MGLSAAWAAIAVVAAAMLYHWRRSSWRQCAVIVAAAFALAALFLGTGPSATFVFHQAGAVFVGTVIAALVTVPVLNHVLPRLRSRADRWSAAILCAILAVMFGSVGLMLWRVADDGLQLASVPHLRTAEEILESRNGASRDRIFGVLVEGRLGEPDRSDPDDNPHLMASYECRQIGMTDVGRDDSVFLPSSFTVTLADGRHVWAQGISSVWQAWNWPPTRRSITDCGLREGDPVVFWGDPGAVRELGSDEQQPALNAVKVIAYGDIDSFADTFVPAAHRTGRAALALAVLNGAMAVVLVANGWRSYRRLDRYGTDDASRIKWTRIAWKRT